MNRQQRRRAAAEQTKDQTSTRSEMTKPYFVFRRLHDIELEGGYILAGMLIIDIPKQTELNKQHDCLIKEIIQELVQRALFEMPHGAVIHARPSGSGRPWNADFKDEEAIKS